ncbi:MAG TPA: FkbM family methyltransferase [Solirubrobacteraceae bacterium]|nr:FkbM family methyltransferase [Solirubrobacteraceae bacterium]
MLGGRPGRMIARALLEPGQYAAVARMARRYPAFADVLKRYLLGGGDYPYACRVRTPLGIVAPVTYTHHDIFTVQEVFGREDYRAGDELRVAVDVGSNIGISALYFLTRNPQARCYLYEPVPRNLERLRDNLAGYGDRYQVEDVAVASAGGTVAFTVEPFGRYGGIGVPGDEHIEVRCRAIADVLDEVLEREGRIDLLKIDTEGAELDTVRAIRADQLSLIDKICFETSAPYNPDPGQFAMHFAAETCRLERRSPPLRSARTP